MDENRASKNDTVVTVGAAELAAELVGIGLPPSAASMIAAEVRTLGDDRDASDAQGSDGENEDIEEAATTHSAVEIESEPEPELEPEETYITGAEMGTWDEDVVAAWLTASARLGAPELAAALSVELEGADLVEATDAMLKGLCKKVINHWP